MSNLLFCQRADWQISLFAPCNAGQKLLSQWLQASQAGKQLLPVVSAPVAPKEQQQCASSTTVCRGNVHGTAQGKAEQQSLRSYFVKAPPQQRQQQPLHTPSTLANGVQQQQHQQGKWEVYMPGSEPQMQELQPQQPRQGWGGGPLPQKRAFEAVDQQEQQQVQCG